MNVIATFAINTAIGALATDTHAVDNLVQHILTDSNKYELLYSAHDVIQKALDQAAVKHPDWKVQHDANSALSGGLNA